MPYSDELYAFAFFSDYEAAVRYLAENLASHEEWDFSDSTGITYPILKNYLEFTYRRLKKERLPLPEIINMLVLTRDWSPII